MENKKPFKIESHGEQTVTASSDNEVKSILAYRFNQRYISGKGIKIDMAINAG
jgi:hypothetical protein